MTPREEIRPIDLSRIEYLRNILDKTTQEDIICDTIDGKSIVCYSKKAPDGIYDSVNIAENMSNEYDAIFFSAFRLSATQLLELAEQALKQADAIKDGNLEDLEKEYDGLVADGALIKDGTNERDRFTFDILSEAIEKGIIKPSIKDMKWLISKLKQAWG